MAHAGLETEGAARSSAIQSLSPGTHRNPRVLVLDLWCYLPYYDSYFCRGLRDAGVDFSLASISYHRDPNYLRRLGLRKSAGLLDIVSRLSIRNARLRQSLKFVEFCVNSLVLAVRCTFSRPDILHVQFLPLVDRGLPLEIWFLAYAKRFGIKIVHTVHNVLPQGTGRLRGEIYQKVYKMADALICQNEAARLRLEREFGIDPEKIWLIPHGPMFYDQDRLSPDIARQRIGVLPNQHVVLWQGIVRPYKGVDFLLEAWSRIKSDGKENLLVIAGSGEQTELQGIVEKVRALGIESSVRLVLRFLSVEDVASHYQAADIVVYPYSEITTSGALMTGLSYGKALIATDLPPFRELLRDGENALLVAYGDTDGLANALNRLLADPEERCRLGANVRAEPPAEDPWLVIARNTAECYQKVLDGEI